MCTRVCACVSACVQVSSVASTLPSTVDAVPPIGWAAPPIPVPDSTKVLNWLL